LIEEPTEASAYARLCFPVLIIRGEQAPTPTRLIAETHDTAAFSCVQAEYNILARDIERDMVPFCKEYGVGLVPYYPLASGLLTGTPRDMPLNIPNAGQAPYLPDSVVVETMCTVDGDGAAAYARRSPTPPPGSRIPRSAR
jgi:hypothetical protein